MCAEASISSVRMQTSWSGLARRGRRWRPRNLGVAGYFRSYSDVESSWTDCSGWDLSSTDREPGVAGGGADWPYGSGTLSMLPDSHLLRNLRIQ